MFIDNKKYEDDVRIIVKLVCDNDVVYEFRPECWYVLLNLFALLCVIVGRGGQIAQFGKKPSSAFNYYKGMT